MPWCPGPSRPAPQVESPGPQWAVLDYLQPRPASGPIRLHRLPVQSTGLSSSQSPSCLPLQFLHARKWPSLSDPELTQPCAWPLISGQAWTLSSQHCPSHAEDGGQSVTSAHSLPHGEKSPVLLGG